jgi:DNA polymerase-4
MPSATARRLCPHAVFLPGDHDLYSAVSRDVRQIFARVTPLVEPLALDEAFLDVTGSQALFGRGVTIAHRLRAEIHDELGLDCSVGVAPNKFLAKLASVDAKPRPSPDGITPGPGVFEVRPGEELAYLHPLPVGRLWGVGPSTLERLRRMGVATVGDLAALTPAAVISSLGKAHGRQLLELAAGRDDRPVEPAREMKSISHEETFAHDLHERADVQRELVRLADAVAARLREHGTGARTFTLKVRDGGFTTITRATTVAGAIDTAPTIVAATAPLLEAVDLSAGVRLLGLAASKFATPAEQLAFDDLGERSQRWSDASRAIDDVRERFGESAIGPASSVAGGRIRLVRSGTQQWGPDHQTETGSDDSQDR